MPESHICKLCPNYPFCSTFRGEEAMQTKPCPYEVLNNGKVEKPTAPLVLIGKR